MKKVLSLLIIAVMIMIGIYATGTAKNVEADVLPEIASLGGDAGIVLDNAISTNFEFKIYDLESETVVTKNSIYESAINKFAEFLTAVTDHQESFDWYLSDLRLELVTESRIDNTIDDMEYVDTGNIQTAGLILRL